MASEKEGGGRRVRVAWCGMRGVLWCVVSMLFLTGRSVAPTTRYAMRVAYDGTRFKGWQVQPTHRTVQGVLHEALGRRFGGSPIGTLGASRTDTGVHARGQVAHCDLPVEALSGDALELLEHQVNRLLPDDVRVFELRPAPAPEPWQVADGLPWHAIANSRGKRYSYRLAARRGGADPLARLYRAHVAHAPLDLAKLDATLQTFVGEHDFAAFANLSPGGVLATNRSTVRTLRSADLLDEGGGDATVVFELDGAMYKMLRNVVGTAVAVAAGSLDADECAYLLSGAAKRTDNPAKAAPAHGLCLDRVFYDDY